MKENTKDKIVELVVDYKRIFVNERLWSGDPVLPPRIAYGANRIVDITHRVYIKNREGDNNKRITVEEANALRNCTKEHTVLYFEGRAAGLFPNDDIEEILKQHPEWSKKQIFPWDKT